MCPRALESTRDAAQALAITTDALLIGGGVVAATGIILWLVLGARDDSESPQDSQTQVSFACAPTGCSAGLGGRF